MELPQKGAKRKPPVSRLQQFERKQKKDGVEVPELDLPEVESCEHLLAYLFEAGPTCGEHALTWGEIEKWCVLTGVVLTEFEAVALKDLSREYLSMYHEAREPDCPPPYVSRAVPRENVAKRLDRALDSIGSGKKKRLRG